MQMRVEAILDDPEAPWWLRVSSNYLLVASSIPLFLSGAWQVAGACGFLFALYIFPLIPIRFQSRRVMLLLSPGVIRIRGAGLKNMRITRDTILGASTSPACGKTALTLGRNGQGRMPLALLFNDEESCALVRGSLGIGKSGFGILHYKLGPQHGAGFARVLRLTGAAACACSGLGCLTTLLARVAPPLAGFAQLGEQMIVAGFIVAIILALPTMIMLFVERHRSTLELSRKGVTVRAASAPSAQWATIRNVEVEPKQLRIEMINRDTLPLMVPLVTASCMREGVAPADVARALDELNTSIERAQTSFPAVHPVSIRAESLLRRAGEVVGVWRARLDSEVGLMHGTFYRSNSLDVGDLQRIVADPDLAIELRAGAARVLLKFDRAVHRHRVEVALATLGSDLARHQFRVAIADLELEDEDEDVGAYQARSQR